jgi:hypothetical protein
MCVDVHVSVFNPPHADTWTQSKRMLKGVTEVGVGCFKSSLTIPVENKYKYFSYKTETQINNYWL